MKDRKTPFQKVIGKIRADIRIEDNLPNTEYPKAMMTGQQAAKNTATVNCGGEWVSGQRSHTVALRVMRDERFQKYLKDFDAAAKVEQLYIGSCLAYQVRIIFKEA